MLINLFLITVFYYIGLRFPDIDLKINKKQEGYCQSN